MITCLGVETAAIDPYNSKSIVSYECPSLGIKELDDIQEYVSDKRIEIVTLEQFAFKQANKQFKPNVHYWFIVRNDGEVRFIGQYADDVVDFFERNYFIQQIGHSSLLPKEEYIQAYNDDDESSGKVVKYAGTFETDNDGKIEKWCNDSGHFQPSNVYATAVAEAMGIADAVFIPFSSDRDSVKYQNYQEYTGEYKANAQKGNYLWNELDENKYVFSPQYHEWYINQHHTKRIDFGRYNHKMDVLSSAEIAINVLTVLVLLLLVCWMVVLIYSVFGHRFKSKRIKHRIYDGQL